MTPKPTFTPSQPFNNRKTWNLTHTQQQQQQKKEKKQNKKQNEKEETVQQLKFEWKNKATHFALTKRNGNLGTHTWCTCQGTLTRTISSLHHPIKFRNQSPKSQQGQKVAALWTITSTR